MNKKLIAFNKVYKNILKEPPACNCWYNQDMDFYGDTCDCMYLEKLIQNNKGVDGFIIKRALRHKNWNTVFSKYCVTLFSKYCVTLVNKRKYRLMECLDNDNIYPARVTPKKKKKEVLSYVNNW